MNLTALLLALKTLMESFFSSLTRKIKASVDRLNAHVLDNDNPHEVTKTQLGLSEVMNYPPSTKQEAMDGVSNQSNMTPLRTDQYMDHNVYKPLTDILDAAIVKLDQ